MLVAVIDQIDTCIDLLVLHPGESWDVRVPRLGIVSDEVVCNAGKLVQSFDARGFVSPDESHANELVTAHSALLLLDSIGRVVISLQPDHSLLRRQKNSVATSACHEPYALGRLAVVNLETQGHGAEVFIDWQLIGFSWFAERVFGRGRKRN